MPIYNMRKVLYNIMETHYTYIYIYIKIYGDMYYIYLSLQLGFLSDNELHTTLSSQMLKT